MSDVYLNKYTTLLAVAGLFLLLPVAAAADADLQLAGHALGEPRTRISADARFECTQQTARGFTATCHARSPQEVTIGAVPLQFLALHYDGDKLAAVEARVPELRHREAAQALASEFGEAKAESEKLRAGMGGIFENAIYLWRRVDAVLRLEQFFRSITTSSLILTTEAHLSKLVIPKRTDARTGIKDL
jgi:hypothetical protein